MSRAVYPLRIPEELHKDGKMQRPAKMDKRVTPINW
jgi:hypothetical protein